MLRRPIETTALTGHLKFYTGVVRLRGQSASVTLKHVRGEKNRDCHQIVTKTGVKRGKTSEIKKTQNRAI